MWGNDYIDEGGHLFYARGLGVSQPLILVEGGVEHLEDVRALLDVVRQRVWSNEYYFQVWCLHVGNGLWILSIRGESIWSKEQK